ncbi:50S ribosomal protein L29 [Candidatus Pyrohabitans sp.]
MAILRAGEIRDMGREELQEKLSELRMELLTERSKAAAVGVPENPGRMRELRRTIARILTVMKEKYS